jgi:predicted negative regulator of RcsB-dependent stress response
MATTTKLTKKDLQQQDEFIETVFDLGEWLEANWRRAAIILGALVAVVLIVLGWMSLSDRSRSAANDLLAKGMQAYQPDAAGGKAASPNYAEALTSFEQAADKAGSGSLGQVARVYQARTLIAMGRAAEAVPILTQVASSGNGRLAAQAKMSLAEASVATGDLERAATTLQEVITSMDKTFPPDGAMMRLAQVREAQGKPGDARKIYDEIVAKYANSPFATAAKQRSTDIAAGK